MKYIISFLLLTVTYIGERYPAKNNIKAVLKTHISTDPYEILRKASEACKQLDRLEYDVIIHQAGVEVVGHVVQQAAQVKNVGFGQNKVLVNGKVKQADNEEAFQFSYDGTVFKLKEKGVVKTIENPTESVIGRTLGLSYYLVVGNYFGDPSGMDNIIDNIDKAEYKGVGLINDREAYIIDVVKSFTHPATQQVSSSTSTWYIDITNFLPVKFEAASVTKKTKFRSFRTKSEDTFDINPDNTFKESNVTGNEPKTEGLLKVGQTLPPFKLENFSGDQVSLEDLNGKVFLIDFWGTWCGPCLLAMPDLQKMHDKYKDVGLNVVGISVGDKKGKPEKYVKSKGYTYSFLLNGDDYARKLGINTFPTIFIVDGNGVILHAEKGRRNGAKAEFEDIIEKHIDQK